MRESTPMVSPQPDFTSQTSEGQSVTRVQEVSFHDQVYSYLDGVSAGPVTCTHIPVALSNCSRHCEVAVLTVHIVSARAGVITQPDADVLHNTRLAFHNLPKDTP